MRLDAVSKTPVVVAKKSNRKDKPSLSKSAPIDADQPAEQAKTKPQMMEENDTYNELLSDLQTKIQNIISDKYVSLSDRDWYNNSVFAITVLTNVYKIPRENCFNYVIDHFVDTLKLKQKLVLLKELFKQETDFTNTTGQDIAAKLRAYFLKRMYQTKTIKMVLLCKEDPHEKELAINVLFTFNRSTNTWREATTSDLDNPEINEWRQQKFNKRNQILEKVNGESKIFLTSPPTEKELPFSDKIESNFGFIHMDTKNQYKFRIKNVLQTRNNLGANCDESGKIILIGKINHFLRCIGKELDSAEYLTKEPNYMDRDIQLIPLCVIFEMLMRYYTEHSEKIYFMTSEEATESHIRKVIVIPQTVNGKQEYVFQPPKKV
jgi:hypothetical protein